MEITKRQLMQIIKEEASALKVSKNKRSLNEAGLKDTVLALVAALGLSAGDLGQEDLKAVQDVLVDFSQEGKPVSGDWISKGVGGRGKEIPGVGRVGEADIKESVRNIVRKHARKRSKR